jgi:DNA-binding HxlR family transcriptional regulator
MEKEELEKMDTQCLNIILTLLAYEKPRFNKLFRTLKYYDPKLSTRTLAEHLKHLTNKGWIIRKEEAKQYVTYELTEDKINFLKPAKPLIEEQIQEQLILEDKLDETKVKVLTRKELPRYKYLGKINGVKFYKKLKKNSVFNKIKKMMEVKEAEINFYKKNLIYQNAFNTEVNKIRAVLDATYMPDINTARLNFETKEAELKALMEV